MNDNTTPAHALLSRALYHVCVSDIARPGQDTAPAVALLIVALKATR
jgi:hypothetical protein